MSLPMISGRGFLISDGVELKYSENGTPYARLPLVFKNTRRTESGEWTHDKEILIQGTVFGRLAEELNDVVSGRTELYVTGQVYNEEYEGKTYTRMLVQTVWPVREEAPKKVPVSVGASAGDDSDIPF